MDLQALPCSRAQRFHRFGKIVEADDVADHQLGIDIAGIERPCRLEKLDFIAVR